MEKRMKRLLVAVICVFAVLGFVLMGVAVQFTMTTLPSGRLEAYCMENDAGERSKGAFGKANLSGFDGYRFYYVKKYQAGLPHELFIFREKAFLGDSSTGRWFCQSIEAEAEAPVGTARVVLDEAEQLEGLLFFSANGVNITKCSYTLRINGVEESNEKKLAAKQGFLFGIPGLNADKILVQAEFFNQKGDSVYHFSGVES